MQIYVNAKYLFKIWKSKALNNLFLGPKTWSQGGRLSPPQFTRSTPVSWFFYANDMDKCNILQTHELTHNRNFSLLAILDFDD